MMDLTETELCLGLPGVGNDEVETPTKSSAAGAGSKRGFSETVDLKLNLKINKEKLMDLNDEANNTNNSIPFGSKEKNFLSNDPIKPPAKAQVVGWPPVRNYRKNMMAATQKSSGGDEEGEKSSLAGSGTSLVKVSMDGAPYLRKVHLKMYKSYQDLSDALSKMFSSFTMGSYGEEGMIDFMNERKLMDVLNSADYVPTYEDKDGDWMLVGDVPWEMFVESCKRLRIMKGSEAIGLAPRAMEKCKRRS